MPVRVITPPAALLTPPDVAGDHSADDAGVIRMIAAATRTLDGPNGWLGRSLGKQTLELTMDCWNGGRNFRLPCGPVIQVLSVKYFDGSDVEQTVSPSTYVAGDGRLWFKPGGFTWPSVSSMPGAIRIRYEAGYDAVPVVDGGTGAVPEEAKQAVILMVQHMKSVGAENLFLRSEEVEGIGSQTFTVSDQAGALVKRHVDDLVGGLRIYTL